MTDVSSIDILVAHLLGVIHDPVMPEIPAELTDIENLAAVQEQMAVLRDILNAFSRGEFSLDIRSRGAIAGRLKSLQAGLLHLRWQIHQIANGDFSQRIDFFGELASSFNDMVVQFDAALTTLRQKEEELTRLTLVLQNEIAQKAETMDALKKSEARFRYMAEHDALTNVCNRRSFYDLAVMELERARRERSPCALILFDIDYFKRFNDSYGHLDGDAALCHVTQAVKNELRDQDILGRYGGEEFVLLLPGTDQAISEAVAERLRLAVANSPVETKTAGPATLTISLGIALVPPQGSEERKTSFLERYLVFADNALYKAKKSGRNCCRTAPCFT